jgi:predicted lipoprotein with Yx(FWY)xxD motif
LDTRLVAVKALLTAAALSLSLASVSAIAEGDPAPTIERERAMQKYKGCHFTNEMGQYLYQCVKKNDGFGTHWCYDETLEVYCPAQLDAQKKAEGNKEKASN